MTRLYLGVLVSRKAYKTRKRCVIPTHVGIQNAAALTSLHWFPAFAGMTSSVVEKACLGNSIASSPPSIPAGLEAFPVSDGPVFRFGRVQFDAQAIQERAFGKL
jgi:hypothetical protein